MASPAKKEEYKVENQNKNVTMPSINEVQGFNPADFARTLQQKDGSESLFLEVKYRILWFRLHRPNGKIETEVLSVTDQAAVMRCRVYADREDAPDRFIAQACAQRFRTADEYGDRFLEIAETAAIGRALASAGYGTQFCAPNDLLSGVISDAPVQVAEENAGGSVHALHELSAGTGSEVPAQEVPIKTAPTEKGPEVQTPAAPSQPAPPKRNPQTMEDYLESMSLDDAKKVIVDFGRYAGKTLENIALTSPGDLEWYVKNYSGKNLAVKAGAAILLNAAQAKAS